MTLLVILDLNGAILDSTHKKRRNISFDFKARTKFIYYRPGMREFLQFLKHQSGIKLAVWTSCKAENARAIVSHVFANIPLEFCFNREECELVPGPGFKTIKNLEYVWTRFPQWNASNTVMIDNSPEKIAKQPNNLIKVREFIAGQVDEGPHELKRVQTVIQRYVAEMICTA